MKRRTHSDFINELSHINNKIVIEGKFVNTSEKVDCLCSVCGHRWKATPSKLLIGRGCPKCAQTKRANARRNTLAQVKNRLDKIGANVDILDDYKSCDIPIRVRCRKCGYEWSPTISNLYAGKKCPKCSNVYRRTNAEFVEELKKINPNIKCLSPFKTTHEKIKCECKKCGYTWESQASSLLAGYGCAKCAGCAKIRSEDFLKITRDQVKNLHIDIVGVYKNAKTPIECHCKKCGLIWNAIPVALSKGVGCPQCNERVKTHDYFMKQINDMNLNIEIISKYEKAHKKIDCHCLQCGLIWQATPHSILQGHGCPECSKKILADLNSKSDEQFKYEMSRINSDIEIIGNYIRNNQPVICRCKICNNEWTSLPRDLLMGKRCPNCYGYTGTSFAEQFILLSFRRVLKNKNIISRDRKTIGMELDIYIPSLKLALEPGAWYWHKDKLERDELKRILCKNEGIRLITIYDSCDLNKPPFPYDNYIFPFDLSSEKGINSLKRLIIRIMKEYHLNHDIIFSCFDEIVDAAKKKSRRRGTKEFIDELKKINDSITVIGEYHRTHEKIKCKCDVCGYVWMGIPSGLLSGAGCPKCAGNYRKTHNEFVSQIAEISPDIEIKGKYISDSSKIECLCKKCGNVWRPLATSLVQGHGCPICAKKHLAIKYAKTTEEFIDEIAIINPNIEVLGKYKNARTKILCHCKICGNQWSPVPDSLVRGSGCPICARKRKKKNRG